MALSKNEIKAIQKGLTAAFPEVVIQLPIPLHNYDQQIMIEVYSLDRKEILELSILAEDWDVKLDINRTDDGLLITYS